MSHRLGSAGLPPERAGMAAPEALVRTRAAIAAAPAAWPPHAEIVTHATERAGIACLELVPATVRHTILYLHGGGYRLGRCEGWTGFAAALADRLSARIVLADYRLAPEHPFPAALGDALAVFRSVGENGPVIVAGDSAGGGLAAALVLAARQAGLLLPRAAILLSPWLDLTLSGETFRSNAGRDQFFPLANATEAAAQYLQGHSATDPLASPLFADLAGFPPTLILAGGAESLLDDATRFAERLASAGSVVEARFVAEMQHVWPLLFPDLRETGEAIATIADFVERIARA